MVGRTPGNGSRGAPARDGVAGEVSVVPLGAGVGGSATVALVLGGERVGRHVGGGRGPPAAAAISQHGRVTAPVRARPRQC